MPNELYKSGIKHAKGFLSGLACLACLGVGAEFFMRVGERAFDTREPGDLIPIVARTADTNRDGATTPEEWIKVYREAGVPFDSLNPEQLTSRQMIDYLKRRNVPY